MQQCQDGAFNIFVYQMNDTLKMVFTEGIRTHDLSEVSFLAYQLKHEFSLKLIISFRL